MKEYKFVLKNGTSPEYIGSPVKINAGESCILVFDDNTCVGLVWEHCDSKQSEADAIGQSEIRFFDTYKNSYGVWHRMFVGGQRLSYARLQTELTKTNEYAYRGKIRGN